jgi:hypothetical protein
MEYLEPAVLQTVYNVWHGITATTMLQCPLKPCDEVRVFHQYVGAPV